MKSLDELFEETRTWLQHAQPAQDRISYLYSGLNDHPTGKDKRYAVISHLLDLVEEIQEASNAVPNVGGLVSISLHDMKTFNLIITLIVLEGIHPALSDGVGIPVELRSKKIDRVTPPKRDPVRYRALLELVVARLVKVLGVKSDVRDLILVGPHSTDFICAISELAFNPSFPQSKEGRDNYDFILSQMDTYSLYTYLTALLRPGSPSWFMAAMSRTLAMLPISRSNGVSALVEFVAKIREQESISLTDLEKGSLILRSVPKGVDLKEYSSKLGQQFVEILGGKSRNPDIAVATVQILGSLYQERKEIVQGFELSLQQILNPDFKDLPVSDAQIEQALRAISSVLKDASRPGLIFSIAKRTISSIWGLYCYLQTSRRPSESVRTLIVSLINTSDGADTPRSGISVLEEIIKSLLKDGGIDWVFGPGSGDGVEIRRRPPHLDEDPMKVFRLLENRIDSFMKIPPQLSESIVSTLFVDILKRWLHTRRTLDAPLDAFTEKDPFVLLADVQLLKELADKEKSKLLKSSSEIIEVISGLINEYTLTLEDRVEAMKLKKGSHPALASLGSIVHPWTLGSDDENGDGDSDDEDKVSQLAEQEDMVKLSLSLISGLIIEEVEGKDMKLLQAIKPQLEYIVKTSESPVLVDKALNTLEVLKDPSTMFDGDDDGESIKVYRKALASLEDPLIPIRAYGLNLIRGLINKSDAVIELKATLKVLLKQLEDEDSFIYLNAIKALDELTNMFKPESTVLIFLGIYIDHEADVDYRLRMGEVLLRVVHRRGNSLQSETAENIAGSLIAIISVGDKKENVREDDRMRMSALSLLGVLCEVNPLGIGRYIPDAVDCVVGVLTFERTEAKAIMRRSAIVLIASLLKGLPTLDRFPRQYVSQVESRIKCVEANDQDVLVRIQAEAVLELFEEKMRV